MGFCSVHAMSSHSLQPIPLVAAYVRRTGGATVTPIVAEHFSPAQGWRRHPWRKRISRSYASSLRRGGVTHVALEVAPGRRADFSLAELTRAGSGR